MAKESVAILKGRIDVSEVLDELNAALSEEWLAFYQYWVGALVVKEAMYNENFRNMLWKSSNMLNW